LTSCWWSWGLLCHSEHYDGEGSFCHPQHPVLVSWVNLLALSNYFTPLCLSFPTVK
jgi:hypothetical protein